jgi:hypothetical protein
VATPTLAKSPTPEFPQHQGTTIEELERLVERVSRPKPPQPDLSTTITTPTDEERRERNAAMLNALWALGEQMAEQAFELPRPKPDPLTIALNGFPDVNTSRNYYACCGE